MTVTDEFPQAARTAGIRILVEGERLRPSLDELLSLADYVTMSASFPKVLRSSDCTRVISYLMHY